eukprot:1140523-Pelagomonas_calceolata.AAC.1
MEGGGSVKEHQVRCIYTGVPWSQRTEERMAQDPRSPRYPLISQFHVRPIPGTALHKGPHP